VADELDKGLGGLDAGVVAAVEDAEAPDAAAQLRHAVVGGESHGVGGKGDLGSILGLVGGVPAEGDGGGAVGELLQLVRSLETGVGVQAAVVHHALEQLQALDVLGAVDGVLGVLGVGVCTGVEVVDQRAGAL